MRFLAEANLRFIPAHAGNRGSDRWSAGTRSVHPRACGEQRTRRPRAGRRNGSSPRMRGTVADRLVDVEAIRFIPAHAGNSVLGRVYEYFLSVHPRACGEQHVERNWFHGSLGSSPRMRGTAQGQPHLRGHVRFIPAHAGNRSSRSSSLSSASVHPRACGEQEAGQLATLNADGSSPRMRGTVIRGGVIVAGVRFIPAHAGNSLQR